MKQLKKHPKQQRMEDIKFPIANPPRYVVAKQKEYMKGLKVVNGEFVKEDMKIPGSTTATEVAYDIREKRRAERHTSTDSTYAPSGRIIDGGSTFTYIPQDREYLRSMNREHDYFKDYWRFLAGLILIGSIIIAAVVIL